MSLAPGTQRVPLPCHATLRNVCVWNQGRECLSHLLSREHLDLRHVNRLLPCYPLPSSAGQHHDGGDNPTHTIQEGELHPFLSNHLSVSRLLNLKLDLGTQPSAPQSEGVNGNPLTEHGFFLLAREILRPIKNSTHCKDGKPMKQSHSLYISQQNE